MIDLGDHAAQSVVGRRDHGSVRAGGTTNIFARPRVAKSTRPIRCGPGIARQQACDHGIRGSSVCGDLRRVRYATQGHNPYALLLTFVVEEEKRLVLRDWPTQRAAELVIVEWG